MTGKAEAGVEQAHDLNGENVMAALYDAHVIDEEKTLWVTGHSLGGALALLAANRLDHIGIKVHEVQTFGTPQVLDPVAANAYPIPVRRFINNEDPIRSEEHTSELQSRPKLVCRLLLEKKKKTQLRFLQFITRR